MSEPNAALRWCTDQLDHAIADPKRFIALWSVVILAVCARVTEAEIATARTEHRPIDLPIHVLAAFTAVLSLYTYHGLKQDKLAAGLPAPDADNRMGG